MRSPSKSKCLAAWLLAIVLLGRAQAADNAPKAVPITAQSWTEKTWAIQRQKGPRPAAYLFTASYCGTCAEAFAVLEQAARGSTRRVELVAIFTDIGADQAPQYTRHFSGLTQLYAFDGFEPAIRQSVDPQWANITPYTVLVDRRGQIQRVLGSPDEAALKRWLSKRP